MSAIPKSLVDYWAEQKTQQNIKPPIPRVVHKKTDEDILDSIDIDVIERYLRKKKLEKIKTDNDR